MIEEQEEDIGGEEGYEQFITPALKDYLTGRVLFHFQALKDRKGRRATFNEDTFEDLIISACEDAAAAGLIQEHQKLGIGMTLAFDDDYFKSVSLLSKAP